MQLRAVYNDEWSAKPERCASNEEVGVSLQNSFSESGKESAHPDFFYLSLELRASNIINIKSLSYLAEPKKSQEKGVEQGADNSLSWWRNLRRGSKRAHCSGRRDCHSFTWLHDAVRCCAAWWELHRQRKHAYRFVHCIIATCEFEYCTDADARKRYCGVGSMHPSFKQKGYWCANLFMLHVVQKRLKFTNMRSESLKCDFPLTEKIEFWIMYWDQTNWRIPHEEWDESRL